MLTAEVVITWVFFLLVAGTIALVTLPPAKLRKGVRLVALRNAFKLRRIAISAWAVFLCLFVVLLLLVCVDWYLHILLQVDVVR